MKTYLITYDLLKPGQDYSPLHLAIRSIDMSAWHGLESVWIVRSDLTVEQITSYLRRAVDFNDRLLVIHLPQDGVIGPLWVGRNLPDVQSLLGVTGTFLVPTAA